MQSLLLSAIAILCACSTAWAQSPLRFSQSGLIKLESLSVNQASQDFIFSTSDMGLRYALGEQITIGGDLGIDSLRVDGQSGGKVFATAVIDSPYGKFSAGIPRLVMPQVFDVPALGGSEVLDLLQGLASGEVVGFMTYFSPDLTLSGLRYDGTFGKVSIAASVQELAPQDRVIHALAASYVHGAYQLSLGRADVDLGPSVATTTKIALRGQKGRISGGVVASYLDALGPCESTLNGFVGYDLTDQITVEGQVFDMITARDRYRAWGADVVYRHRSGLFMQTGTAQLSPQADHIFTLSLGYQF